MFSALIFFNENIPIIISSMTSGWNFLPLLPLQSILNYLDTKDALAAASTCRHWRTALFFYEGNKDLLKVQASRSLDKNVFISRLFRKQLKSLHVYLDCNKQDVDNFTTFIMPLFLDTIKLEELLIIGPCYLKQTDHSIMKKLRRIIMESIVFKHMHCLKKLAFLGCEMDIAKNENDRYVSKQVDYYSRLLTFNNTEVPEDAILTRRNVSLVAFSTLQHVILDYDTVNTEALETLSQLPELSHITLNFCNKRDLSLEALDWQHLIDVFGNTLSCSVNIISCSGKAIDQIMDKVLMANCPLVSIKVMFCKMIYIPLLLHLGQYLKDRLCELVWADSPKDREEQPDNNGERFNFVRSHLNPFVMMCWHCPNIKKIVIHGYWIWHYDLIGMVRLRDLETLDVSSVFTRSGRYNSLAPLRPNHATPDLPRHQVKEINQYTNFDWQYTPPPKLHPGLRARSTYAQKSDYVLQQATQSLGVT